MRVCASDGKCVRAVMCVRVYVIVRMCKCARVRTCAVVPDEPGGIGTDREQGQRLIFEVAAQLTLAHSANGAATTASDAFLTRGLGSEDSLKG
eukprot:6177475-Pleurochrysis_carterae.AAC.3